MSKLYQSFANCSPSQKENSYVYTIIPVIENGLAAITSSDELLLLDRRNLSTSPTLRLPDVPVKVSCLVSGDDAGNTILCAGGDGSLAVFDVRIQTRVSQFKIDRAITALACHGNHVALGTEFARHQAIVSVWDWRQNQQLWQNAENNDDITALDFHPSRNNLILSGGDDGQLSIFDSNIADEDESLLQGVNYGPIHKAGFLGDGRFFGLSSDQNMSIYPISSPDDNEDPRPVDLGDLRSVVPCEYIVDVFKTGEGFAVAAGTNNSESRVEIVELRHAIDLKKEPKLKSKTGYILDGGHGEEIVRSIFADDASGTIFTSGEDGQIKAFKRSVDAVQLPSNQQASAKSKIGPSSRYKPY